MTIKEQALKIEKIYNEAIKKIRDLGKERQIIISTYLRKLEKKKIEMIKSSITNEFKNNKL